MDQLTIALVAGLLGGGVTGAVVAGLIGLLTQQRTFEHERRARFLDLRRERYAALLRESDDWVHAQWYQLDVAKAVQAGAVAESDMPALAPIRPLELLAEEIELLAAPDVGAAAALLADAVRSLAAFDAKDPEQADRMREVASYNEVSAEYTLRRNRFVAAAKADLGTE